MRCPVVPGRRAVWRGLAALLTAAAFLFALAAAHSPGLHESIHKTQGADHECGVTILSTAGVVLGSAAALVSPPAPAPENAIFLSPPSMRAHAPLGFLLLEHAPPARS